MRPIVPLTLLLALPAHAKRPDVATVPSIETVVAAEGFTPTPSQSEIYRPGAVLVPNAQGGHDVVVESCIDVEPTTSIMSQSSIATTLAGGVSARLGMARGAASADVEKRLSFVDPEQRTIPLAKLRPTDECKSGVETAAKFQDLTEAIILHDVLVAMVKNTVCTKVDATGGMVALGSAEASAYSECVQESPGQVPLGFKAVSLNKLLEYEGRQVQTGPRSSRKRPQERTETDETPTDTGVQLKWISLPKGSYKMGSEAGNPEERPVHTVSISAFEVTKSEITVDQYRACVQAGVCEEPQRIYQICENPMGFGCTDTCNYGRPGYENHPVNCIPWPQAKAFSDWSGGRLPTEAEWEYLARSGGKDWSYPWGDNHPTCEEVGVGKMDEDCGSRRTTFPVCSKPKGNSRQGVCDLGGNVLEWTEDVWHDNYNGAPSDGSAWAGTSYRRVVRGGGWTMDSESVRASYRYNNPQDTAYSRIGFRVVRPSTP